MKKIKMIVITLVMLLTMTACGNQQFIDTTYTFDRAVVCMPDGSVVDGKVDSWRDYPDGDQIQVKINGVTYLVHSSNIALIAE